jgi:hypothetical protein
MHARYTVPILLALIIILVVWARAERFENAPTFYFVHRGTPPGYDAVESIITGATPGKSLVHVDTSGEGDFPSPLVPFEAHARNYPLALFALHKETLYQFDRSFESSHVAEWVARFTRA